MSVLQDLQTIRQHIERTLGVEGTILDEKKKKMSSFIKSLRSREDIKDPEAVGGFVRFAKANHLAQWKKKGKKGKK